MRADISLFTIFLYVAAIISLSSSAAVGEPMNGAAFDTFTRGKTLFYGQNGQAYGAETYHDNNRVQWSFLDGNCKEGFWYEEAGQICFIYEDNPTPQCWAFREEAGRLTARFEDMPGATQLYQADDMGEEMICLGPDVGV